jgi:hypothetical protein
MSCDSVESGAGEKGYEAISPVRKRKVSAVISSSVLGREPPGVYRCLLNRWGTIIINSTYDAAKASPEVLATERWAVDIAEPTVREFVPRRSVGGFTFTRVSFSGHV